jgi:phenylpropionate dioxygenase-like ring-hydroxylating dioxygenase large terminal subunit
MNKKLYYVVFMLFGYTNAFVHMLNSALSKKHDLQKITEFPKLNYNELTERDKYDLQWYVIGEKTEFVTNKPKTATIWNKNYVVWKNENGSYVGLDDICSHKSAALSKGKVCNNNIVCPYHGYEFDQNGTLTKVPGICFRPSPVYNIDKYQVVEKNGWVYLNTYTNATDFTENIFVEDEVARNDSVVFLNMNFNCYSRILSENSLDVMHIGFVHTFGNKKNPAPIEEHPPRLVGNHHYKTSYLYEAGDDAMSKKVFGVKTLRIENEFILPHTTVARVIFGDYISTVITFASPINDKKSKLYVKTYRNFWNNPLGDLVTEKMMFNTMLQDKLVVENIDFDAMDGKFNMKFDKLQNTYKSFYKRFIHDPNKEY